MFNASDLTRIGLTSSMLEVNRFIANLQYRVISMLRVLEGELAAKITEYDLSSIASPVRRRVRTEAMLRELNQLVTRRFGMAAGRLSAELTDLASLSQKMVVNQINGLFRATVTKATLTRADLSKIVGKIVVRGEPFKDLWLGQVEATRHRIFSEIRLGVVAGETNDAIIRRIRGTRSGRTTSVVLGNGKVSKVPVYSGGTMDTAYRNAQSLVRTGVNAVTNEVLLASYRENEDMMIGFEAIVTLDGRTSFICMGRVGFAWTIDGDPVPGTPTDITFPGAPGWHWNCRTFLGPLFKAWDTLVAEADKSRQKALDEVPESVRETMDGKPGQIDSFDAFMNTQEDSWARSKLGPARLDLWKSGKLTTRQLVDQTGRTLTLSELEAQLGL